MAVDHNGEPIDAEGHPLDPKNVAKEDAYKLEGLIVDNVSIDTAFLAATFPRAYDCSLRISSDTSSTLYIQESLLWYVSCDQLCFRTI